MNFHDKLNATIGKNKDNVTTGGSVKKVIASVKKGKKYLEEKRKVL